jgi:hypothetical protein
MQPVRAAHILRIAAIGLIALLGASLAAPAPASAQTKTGGTTTFGTTAPTAPPPVIHVQPQPKPQIKLYYQPNVPEIPEIPTDPRGRPETIGTGSQIPVGNTGNLGQLNTVSSIGQLLALPAADEARGPSQVLHKLENRLPSTGAAGQTTGNPDEAGDRAGALKALENAKPIL